MIYGNGSTKIKAKRTSNTSVTNLASTNLTKRGAHPLLTCLKTIVSIVSFVTKAKIKAIILTKPAETVASC